MGIKETTFNRPLRLNQLWGLRHIFSIVFIRILNPNILANIVRFLRSRILKDGRISNMPLYAMIETSSRCNLRCKMCWRTLYPFNRAEGDMPYSRFKEIIDRIGKYLIFVAMWNYGEPLLNPELSEMIRYSSDKGLVTILSTNGCLLNRERSESLLDAGLKYLIVCVDGTTEDTYQKYRSAARLSDIEGNVRQLCKLKKQGGFKFPIIELQFIAMKDNEHQVNDFFALAYSWGADRASLKKFSMFRNYKLVNEFAPKNKEYLLTCYKNKKYALKKFCPVAWKALVINSDGQAVPCCSDYFSLEKMGNVFADDVDKVWNGDNYIKFRSRVKSNINSIEICYNCPHMSGQAGSFISARQF